MGAARFRYALEPIALQRQWALDALLRDLSECNFVMAQRRGACDAVIAEVALAGQEWQALGSDGQPVRVERFTLLSRFLADRQRQVRAMEQAIDVLQRQRDEVIEQIAMAQRGVDAVNEHRGQMRREFVRARLSGEYKLADDQWNVLQTVRDSDGD